MEDPQEKQPAHPHADFGMSELGSSHSSEMTIDSER